MNIFLISFSLSFLHTKTFLTVCSSRLCLQHENKDNWAILQSWEDDWVRYANRYSCFLYDNNKHPPKCRLNPNSTPNPNKKSSPSLTTFPSPTPFLCRSPRAGAWRSNWTSPAKGHKHSTLHSKVCDPSHRWGYSLDSTQKTQSMTTIRKPLQLCKAIRQTPSRPINFPSMWLRITWRAAWPTAIKIQKGTLSPSYTHTKIIVEIHKDNVGGLSLDKHKPACISWIKGVNYSEISIEVSKKMQHLKKTDFSFKSVGSKGKNCWMRSW